MTHHLAGKRVLIVEDVRNLLPKEPKSSGRRRP
jgi:hypothetical protein